MTPGDLARYLDAYLRTTEIADYPMALNGVQVDCGRAEVRRVGLAVDAADATIREAVKRDVDVLIVHHGLFWDGTQPLTGRRYKRIKLLMDADVGLYSSHLPLDAHPEVGNNAVLARELGISIEGSFGEARGTPIGVHGRLELRREALAARLDQVLGARVKLIPGGPERLRRVGVVSGGGGGQVQAARDLELDALVTGEGSHHNYFDAVEGGLNLYLGGHYATEVWGVRALGRHLEERLEMETFFIDHPTGL